MRRRNEQFWRCTQCPITCLQLRHLRGRVSTIWRLCVFGRFASFQRGTKTKIGSICGTSAKVIIILLNKKISTTIKYWDPSKPVPTEWEKYIRHTSGQYFSRSVCPSGRAASIWRRTRTGSTSTAREWYLYLIENIFDYGQWLINHFIIQAEEAYNCDCWSCCELTHKKAYWSEAK